jgi:hypothetical protein
VARGAPGAARRAATGRALALLDRARDRLAGQIKGELEGAAFADIGIRGAAGQTLAFPGVRGGGAPGRGPLTAGR